MVSEIRYHLVESADAFPMTPQRAIWPTYDGYCKDDYEVQFGRELEDSLDEAWSGILSEALSRFCGGLQVTTLLLARPSRWWWQKPQEPVWRRVQEPYRGLGRAALAQREHAGHDLLLHVLSDRAWRSESPDFGRWETEARAVLSFGIEEAVLYGWWADWEAFRPLLEDQADRFGHALVASERPFVSHWHTVGRGLVDYRSSD